MAFEWIDKVDGVDDVVADDINSIAHAVQKNAFIMQTDYVNGMK